jgi:hypothetical protein
MTRMQKYLINMIVNSLKNSPDDWKIEEFWATNEHMNIKIWISNSWYGMEINTMNDTPLMGGSGRGSVTAISSFFGWATWRGKIIRAVNRIIASRIEVKLRKVIHDAKSQT